MEEEERLFFCRLCGCEFSLDDGDVEVVSRKFNRALILTDNRQRAHSLIRRTLDEMIERSKVENKGCVFHQYGSRSGEKLLDEILAGTTAGKGDSR